MSQYQKSSDRKSYQKQEIRRSGRPRIVNSIYAQSINELKQSIHKKSERNKYQFQNNMGNSFNQDNSCSMQLQQNWIEAIINQEDVKRKIWINIIPPKKKSYETQKIIQKGQQVKKKEPIKKKQSFYKEDSKDNKDNKDNKGVSLLDILLGAAKKVAEENSEQKFYEDKDNESEKDENIEQNYDQKKNQNKMKIQKDERQQQIKKYLRMESKYKNLIKRFEQIKNSIELPS